MCGVEATDTELENVYRFSRSFLPFSSIFPFLDFPADSSYVRAVNFVHK